MTTKLYYIDAYIKEFDSKVLSCKETESGFLILLEQTAFFPEEGGQSSDGGYIDSARVISVYEEAGVVYHLVDRRIDKDSVHCVLDFEERFEKMQLHTAEHILCGIIHEKYGYENVGFHLGEDVVTFDVSGVLTRAELDEIEDIANKVVFENSSIKCWFPTAEELTTTDYRSKLELSENIRLVKIGDVDICACCAPHVLRTGEVGIIKILDYMKHRGGTRITMQAGARALRDYRIKYENLLRISAMLSIPQHESADELARYMKETDSLRAELRALKIFQAEMLAENYSDIFGNKVFCFDDYSMDQLRAFANRMKEKTEGLVVCVSGREGDYKYLIASHKQDLSAVVKDINKALCGRGGGRGEMVSGSFAATLCDIKKYFEN